MKKNLFNSIKINAPKSNTFDLTHDVKFSAKMGKLVPMMCMEVIPGDRIKIGADSLVRFAPLIAPVMHRMDATIHYFFVPNRLVWNKWEDFITQTGGTISPPYINAADSLTSEQKRHLEYMGVPDPVAGFQEVNALPFAAYQRIYNDYYRDQNLIPEVNCDLIDGNNDIIAGDLLTTRNRAWEHDYFTACLPFAQKGPEVQMPLGDVSLDPDWDTNFDRPTFRDPTLIPPAGNLENSSVGPSVVANGLRSAYDPDGSLHVEPTTINTLRRAFRLQEFLEKMARGGSRYIEQIRAHFGVKSSDARLQRPEYITGVKTPVVISEVLNTTGEDGGLPQGNMAGHAVSVGEGNVGSYYAEEHGFIIGIMSIMPKPAYFQGIHKQFLKRSPLEYYWPSFANIGEQEVLVKELYAYGTNSNDIFGYIPRYSEYKYQPSRVAGDFTKSLDYWHLARKFATDPTLSQEFIEVDPDDVSRIFAVESDEDNLYIHVLNKIVAKRLMPLYGTPNL